VIIVVFIVCDTDEQSVDLIKHKRMRADDFILIKCIGRGAFGEVQLVSTMISRVGTSLCHQLGLCLTGSGCQLAFLMPNKSHFEISVSLCQ